MTVFVSLFRRLFPVRRIVAAALGLCVSDHAGDGCGTVALRAPGIHRLRAGVDAVLRRARLRSLPGCSIMVSASASACAADRRRVLEHVPVEGGSAGGQGAGGVAGAGGVDVSDGAAGARLRLCVCDFDSAADLRCAAAADDLPVVFRNRRRAAAVSALQQSSSSAGECAVAGESPSDSSAELAHHRNSSGTFAVVLFADLPAVPHGAE